MQGSSEGEERARADRALTKTYSFIGKLSVPLHPRGTPMLYGFGRIGKPLQPRRRGVLIAAITRPPGDGRARSMVT